MSTVTEIFGCNVFNDSVMRERLPKDVFMQVQRSINDGKRLDSNRCYGRRKRDEGLGH